MTPKQRKTLLGACIAVIIAIAVVPLLAYVDNEWLPDCSGVPMPYTEPLIVAASQEGCTGCVRSLLRRGVDPDLESPTHVRPLFAAIEYHHPLTAAVLIHSGARINEGKGFSRPLCAAVRSEYARDDAMVRLLVESGANLQWAETAPDYPGNVLDCLVHGESGMGRDVEPETFRYLADHGLVEIFNQLPEVRRSELKHFLYLQELAELKKRGVHID